MFHGMHFFDVVFNLNASTNCSTNTSSVFEQAISGSMDSASGKVEHGVFTPLVFSTTGGMGREATTSYKYLADMIPQKWQHSCPVVMGLLRC